MAERPIFAYRDYKAYIKQELTQRQGKGRGEKARFAQAMQSQGAFVSQVLHGHADLSLEQACLASEYFGHTKEECRYFLLVVQLGRAGSAKLKSHLLEQLEAIDAERSQLKNRVGEQEVLPLEKQATYYSHWLYSAIDAGTSIPALQTRQALAAYFNISANELSHYIGFLLENGLLEEREGKLCAGPAHLFLPVDSPLVSKHHTNWRLKAMQSIPVRPGDGMHYSMVGSISEADAKAVRKLLLGAIEKANAIYRPSREERLFAIGVDFFEVK